MASNTIMVKFTVEQSIEMAGYIFLDYKEWSDEATVCMLGHWLLFLLEEEYGES